MSAPSDPTVNTIITEGMNAAGQTTVTSGSAPHTAFKNAQFQTIKSEIWAACKHDTLLETETCLLAGIGNSTISPPTDFDHETILWVYDGAIPYRGTAQTGAAGSITLASDFTETPAALYGRYIFTLSGTGSGQHRQITGYNDTTKIATVASNWATQPDSTTTYLIGVLSRELRRLDMTRSDFPSLRPLFYNVVGTTMQVFPAPDQIYPIIFRYIPNLTRLDEASTAFVKHIRERRSLWVQGIKAYTVERYDQDNVNLEMPLWQRALSRYAGNNLGMTQMVGNR
jgi:hypothetical protein